jgi:hypothetical protein
MKNKSACLSELYEQVLDIVHGKSGQPENLMDAESDGAVFLEASK